MTHSSAGSQSPRAPLGACESAARATTGARQRTVRARASARVLVMPLRTARPPPRTRHPGGESPHLIMRGMDPYALLGVAPGASERELTRAYRRLAKQWHPDRAGDEGVP